MARGGGWGDAEGATVIADLHCHYPMHLLADDPAAVGPDRSWTEQILAAVKAHTIGVLSNIGNAQYWDSGWRVNLDGLQAGEARIVCSVLYRPEGELDLTRAGKPPLAAYFQDLQHQIDQVEADLRRLDPSLG